MDNEKKVQVEMTAEQAEAFAAFQAKQKKEAEAAQRKAPFPISLKKLVADGRSGKNCLGIRKPLHRFREVAADLGGKWNAQLVRKSGGHI